MQKIISILFLTALFSSCSKVQELDERTRSMKNSTEQMEKTTEQMAKNTSMMYKQKRQVDAMFARDELFQKILDEDIAIEGKLSYASKFYKAFEYQLWNNQDFDSLAYREELLSEALQEFFRQTLEVYHYLKEKKNILGVSRLKRMSPLKIGKSRNDEAAFYALATTMHMNNHHQEFVREQGHQIEILSLYDVITTALKKENRGENMPRYMELVITGENKELSIELLKARFNFLVALAVSDMTTKKNMKVDKKLKAILFKISAGKLGKIELQNLFESANTVTQQQINSYLLAALQTRDILNELAVESKLDKTLQSVINNIDTGAMVVQASQTTEFIRFQNYILKLSN